MGFLHFILFIGILVFVHELGHFLVAKYFDVHVVRFSIGFGPNIIAYTYGETEYCIKAFPLGGYVEMFGGDLESMEGLPESERKRGLMAKPIYQRALVTVAGPLFNIIFPIIIYFVFTMAVTTTPPAVVGEVFVGMPAAMAGVKAGDKIVSLDGEPIEYWYQVIDHITSRPGQEVEVEVERDGKVQKLSITPETKVVTDMLGLAEETYGLIGIHPGAFGSTIIVTNPTGPAAGKLQNFDKIMSVDGKPTLRFDEVEAAVRASQGKPVEVQLLRRTPLNVGYADIHRQEAVTISATPVEVDGQWVLGIQNAEMAISRIEKDSPAAIAGVQLGDLLVKVEGQQVSNWRLTNDMLSNEVNREIVSRQEKDGGPEVNTNRTFEIEVLRNGAIVPLVLTPKVIAMDRKDYYKFNIGWNHIADTLPPQEVPFPFFKRVLFAGETSVVRTLSFGKVMIMGVVRMAQGRLSLDNVGGPIMIGELAAKAGKAGWDKFLQMMAAISINLAVVNMLPVPVLDGGQLMLYFLEAVKRGPLSLRTRQIAAYIGYVLILMLMVLAFKNDIERQWDYISEFVNGA